MVVGTRIESEVRSLVTTPEVLECIRAAAIEKWVASFDRQKLLEILETYSRAAADQSLNLEERRSIFEETFHLIKHVRKATQYLRSAYILLDREHDSPKELATFYWQLGQLKDSIYHPELTKNTVESLKLLLSSPLSKLDVASIELDSPDGILSAIQQPLSIMRKLTEVETLPANSFHTLRKKLRLFANLYSLAIHSCDSEDILALHKELVSLNDELGEINDELVSSSLNGGGPYEGKTVTVQDSIKARIKSLLGTSE